MTLAVTPIGVAPAMAATMPVVDAAMPGFAALLATAAPAVTAEVATPQPLPVGPPVTLSMPLVPDVVERDLVERDVVERELAGRVNLPVKPLGGILLSLPSTAPNPREAALSAPVDALAPVEPLIAAAVSLPPVPRVIAQPSPAAPLALSRATECAPLAEAASQPIEDHDDDQGAPDQATVVDAPPALVSVLAPAPQPAHLPVAAATTPPNASQAAVTAPAVRQRLSALPTFGAKASVPPQALSQPSGRLAVDLRLALAPAPNMASLASMPVEQTAAFSIAAMVSMSNTVPGPSASQPAVAASVVVASVAAPTVNGGARLPAVMPVAAPPRVGPVLRDLRLAQQSDEQDRPSGLVTFPEPGPLRVALRADASVAGPSPTAASDAPPATGVDIGVTSDRLGAVRIGIDGAPGDLRVSLGLSPAAAALVAADAPRLIADLATNGVRLQSLDVSGGGGFAGGQSPSPGQQQPQSQAPMMPRAGLPAAVDAIITVRASTADRYA